MVYNVEQLFPFGAVESEYTQQRVVLGKGIVFRFELYFPPGSCGLTYVRISENDRQIYPVTPNTHFRGENIKFEFDDTYLVDIPPYTWTFEGYNLDDTYDHTIFLNIGFVSDENLRLRYEPNTLEEIYQMFIAAQNDTVEQRRAEAKREITRILEGRL